MFASSLVPPERASRWEFTPIGKRRSQEKSSPKEPKMAINSEKISNSHIDTTFENTDNTDTQQSIQSEIRDLPGAMGSSGPSNPRSGGLFDGLFRSRDKIVSDGGGSVQELNSRLEGLQSENYNLKFEVAMLTKYMRKTPEEQRAMVYENMELKQKLAKALEELDRQAVLVRDAGSSGSSEKAMAALRSSYKEALAEKEHVIEDLEARVAHLRQEQSKSQVSSELYEKLEALQNDNQSLRRKLSEANTRQDLTQSELQEENNELKVRVHELQMKQHEVPENANEQIASLERECEMLQRKLHEAVDDLRSVEGQKEALESKQSSLDTENDALQRRIDALSLELKTARGEKDSLETLVRSIRSQAPGKEKEIDQLHAEMSRLNDSVNRRETDLKEATAEARTLKQQLRKLEDQILEKQHEADRLARKNAHLEKELEAASSLERYKPRGESNTAANRILEEQIDELHRNTQILKAEKRDLEDTIADLEDRLAKGSHSRNDRDDLVAELQDRVEFYEKEYSSLVDEMERNSIRYDSLKQDFEAKELQLEELKAELRSAQREQQRGNSLYLEEEKRRNEEKVYRLERQVNELNSQNRSLEREIEDIKRASDLAEKDKDRLASNLSELESQLRNNKHIHSKLETSVRDKEEIIEALETRLRALSRDYKSKSYYEEALPVKHDFQYEVQSLQREKERSQRELERLQKELNDQQRYYENKLDVLKERARLESIPDDSAMVALFESQLEEAKTQIKALEAQQNELRKADTSYALEDYKERVLDLERRLSSAQKEKTRLKDVIDSLETDMKVLGSEKTQLEVRARNLDSELTKTTRHCNRLARKINEYDTAEYKNSSKNAEEALRAKKTNAQLQAQIDSLNAKLARASISSPFNAPKDGSRRDLTEQRLRQNELLFYKAKLFEIQNKAKDLASVHSMVMSSIRNADAQFRTELAKTALLGVHPEVEKSTPKKLTLKVLANFVLAAVKMKKRQERAAARRGQLLQLREEIEKDRITLLAE